jgi:hypothetical protein
MTEEMNNKIDEFEALLAKCTPVECALNHSWIDGQGYVREIFMPAGTWVTSMIHKYEHPFAIIQGRVSVFSENDGVQILEAGYRGITKPHTRRVLFIHEDCIWVTFHPTTIFPKDGSEESILEAIELITNEIIEKRDNPLLGGMMRNNVLLKTIGNEN